MSHYPMSILIGQFSRFAVETDLNPDDWEMAATEFGVKDILSDTDRFHASWNWGDNDKQANTVQLLTEIADKDEEKAVGVMHRIYTLANTDSDTLRKYPALEILEREDPRTDPLHMPFRTEPFLDINDVPGTFYPGLVESINQCYSVGVNDATLVLTRKLLENLLIDILREKYGTLIPISRNTNFAGESMTSQRWMRNLLKSSFHHVNGVLNVSVSPASARR